MKPTCKEYVVFFFVFFMSLLFVIMDTLIIDPSPLCTHCIKTRRVLSLLDHVFGSQDFRVKAVWIMETWVRTFSYVFTSPICPSRPSFGLRPDACCAASRRSGQVRAVSLEDCGRGGFFACCPEAVNTSRASMVYLLWLRSQQLKPRDTERGSDNPTSLEHLSLWLRFWFL